MDSHAAPSESDEWPMDRKTQEAKDAGFVGFSAGANPTTVGLAKGGLTLVGIVDIGTVVELKPNSIDSAIPTHPCQRPALHHDTPIPEAVEVAQPLCNMENPWVSNLRSMASRYRHRHRRSALIDEYKSRYAEPLRVNFDYSHPAIVKHQTGRFWSKSRIPVDLFHQRTCPLSHLRDRIVKLLSQTGAEPNLALSPGEIAFSDPGDMASGAPTWTKPLGCRGLAQRDRDRSRLFSQCLAGRCRSQKEIQAVWNELVGE